MKEYLVCFRMRRIYAGAKIYDREVNRFFATESNKEARKIARKIGEDMLDKVWQERDKKGSAFLASYKILGLFELKKIRH